MLQMRAELIADLRRYIAKKKLSHAKAAQLFGVSASRVSELVEGSLEMLVSLAAKAGKHSIAS